MGTDFMASVRQWTEDAMARGQQTLSEIPGYSGYRQKEDRRDEDKRVRDQVAAKYRAEGRRVERIAGELADQRRIGDIKPVDDLAKAIQHLVDRVKTATYGYGGIFGSNDIDLTALDQLRAFDLGLLDGVAQLDTSVAALEQAHASGGDLAAPAKAGLAVVRSLQDTFDLRGQVVESGKPAPAEQVLSVLQAPSTPVTAPKIGIGDAVSILGDDFVAEAAITVSGGPAEFELLRLRSQPEEWLLVPGKGTTGYARLKPGDTSSLVVSASGSGQGNATGAGGTSTPRPVRWELLAGKADQSARGVRLNWGADALSLVGTEVDASDIDVYGKPAKGN